MTEVWVYVLKSWFDVSEGGVMLVVAIPQGV